jgi:transposase
VPLAFFPSSQRAQVTALACTLPRESGKPLSRWSSRELAKVAVEKKVVKRISASTIKRWLKAERIKPWQFKSWQKPTDPRFLEKAVPVLHLYERAAALAEKGHIVVCADEKPSIQARKLLGGLIPPRRGVPARRGDRYRRQGAWQLFTALLVHRGETIARCFDHKRFIDFQAFFRMLAASRWCQEIKVLHLILDNGPTHAPKQLELWLQTLRLPLKVEVHWLPLHASWLDQVEIVFSDLQRRVLTPNHFDSRKDLRDTLMDYFRERNKHAKPIRWTYTAVKLCEKMQPRVAACA